MSKFVAFTPEQFNQLDNKLTELGGYYMIACDDMSYEAMADAEIDGVIITRQNPKDFFNSGAWRRNNVRLCWLGNMQIEIAIPQFVAIPNSGGGFSMSCTAKGISSTVWGNIMTDESWTVE